MDGYLTIQLEKWKDGKQSALAITWDDFCYQSWNDFLPHFNQKKIKCSFYVNTVGYYMNGDTKLSDKEVQLLRKIKKTGHELGCHTHSHIDMSKEKPELIKKEISNWFSEMKKYKLISNKDLTFAYPFGSIPKNDQIIRDHFLAARCFLIKGINKASPPNFYRLKTVNYGVRRKLSELNDYVDKNIKEGGFLIHAGHGIENECWSPISKNNLYSHLDYIVSKKEHIWNDTLINIVKYIKQRDNIEIELLEANNKKICCRLSYPKFIFSCIPITISIISRMKIKTITQGGTNIIFQRAGQKYYFDVKINKSKIVITLK
jgi:peptidoglycan/xylan/chitin deacetylase (PgdA/CDA1 family)